MGVSVTPATPTLINNWVQVGRVTISYMVYVYSKTQFI